MTIEGGVRTRFIADSFRSMVLAKIEDLGWLDASPDRQDVVYRDEAEDWEVAVPWNSIRIRPEEWHSEAAGMGDQTLDRMRMYVDFYAENETLGAHFAYDVNDILLGLNVDIGRTGPYLDCYDLDQATPTVFTTVEIEDVRIDRAHGFPKEWQHHWFVISCFLSDEYEDVDD